jgi:hypothetical protein
MRFRTFVLILISAAVALSCLAATTPAKKPVAPKKTAVAASSSKKTAAKKTAASARKTTVAKRVPTVSRQSSPTPDRYKEIQSALAAKGYLKTEPNGVWDAQSIDAMKRYQADQKLDASGKLTAASLIGLGLGPQMSQAQPAAPASAPQ